MKHTFTIENAFKFGWEKTKIHWASFLGLGIIYIFISLLTSIPIAILEEYAMSGKYILLYASFYILSIAVSVWITYNSYKIILKMIDKKDFKIGEIFHWDNKSLANIGNYFLVSLVYGIVIVVGFILPFIPLSTVWGLLSFLSINDFNYLIVNIGSIFSIILSIYFGTKYYFASYLVMDKGMTIGDAFKKSGEMSKGNMLKMIGFAFVSFAVVIVGLMALLVGVIPAIILTTFAGFYIYRKLADGHVAGEYGHTAKVVEEVKEITA